MAAVSALRQTQSYSHTVNAKLSNVAKEPVSFHLAFILGSEYALPEGCDSVDILRQPLTSMADEGKSQKENLTGTKMEFWTKKFNNQCLASHDANEFKEAWQDRLIVITEQRIFILTEKAIANNKDFRQRHSFTTSNSASKLEFDFIRSTGKACLEIVDSIPMEEITSISLDMDNNPGMWDPDPTDTEKRSSQTDLRATERSLRQLRPGLSDQDQPNEPMLRILTKPSKFNRGEPYYFLLREQDFPCLDASEKTAPLRTRDDANALASRLAALAARRHMEHARENRFHRLQKILRHAWNSVSFNLLVLALIVSNFAFTVMQLENKDPDMQPFYENVDLAYTIIFAVGVTHTAQCTITRARLHALAFVSSCRGMMRWSKKA
jgi:hypothetical protein